MYRIIVFISVMLLLVVLSVSGVSAQGDVWDAVRAEVDLSPIEEMVLVVGNADGIVFTYEKGDFTADTAVLIASSSKWLTAATVMRLVEAGIFSLDDHPQDFIPWWTDDPNDPQSQITITQLLSFTSGFGGGPLDIICTNTPSIEMETCTRAIVERWFMYEPGTAFSYGPPHMHILGVMIQYATDMSFNDAFRQWVAEPLGMSDATLFDWPSDINPRPAGGATSTANDYALYLQGLLSGDFLGEYRDLMFTDYTADPVVIANAPDSTEDAGTQWHYAFGAWRECWADEWTEACSENVLISSGGAFGWFPWIDMENGYFAIIGQQGSILAQPAGQSIDLAGQIRADILLALAEVGE